MSVVKGFVRKGPTVINTETAEFELIKQRRAQKRSQDQTSSELTMLREMVERLSERVRKLEDRNG